MGEGASFRDDDQGTSATRLAVRPDDAADLQMYRLVVEHAPIGIVHFDARGVLTACNEHLVALVGKPREALIGLEMERISDPRIAACVRETLAGRRAHFEGDYRFTTARKVAPFRMSFAPILAADHGVTGGVAIVEDITERRAAERAAERSAAAFHVLTESAPDGIAVHREGRFVYVNPAMVRLLGYADAAELIGRPVSAVIHEDDRALVEERTRVMLETGRALPRTERRLIDAHGEVVMAEVAALPIDFADQPAILVQAADLTPRKQMESRLAQADRLASIGTLAAGVAHEINNPLAYLTSSLELSARDLLRAERLQESEAFRDQLVHLSSLIAAARDGAERIRVIVRDLMTFSRARTESPVTVELARVLDAAVSLTWNELRHRARLVKTYRDVSPVLADEARLGQVFVNLLVNAVQSLPDGAATQGEIRLSTSQHDDMVVVEVADNGAGIPPERIPRIFEPFYTTKSIDVGNGLGLAICHGIVKSLGGDISVESAPGRGSTFRVSLPAARPVSAPPRSLSPPAGSVGRLKRVLVIDDEPLLGRTLRMALRGKHDVDVATSGREGLSLLMDGGSYDLVLCDLMMPDVSGIAVYEQISAARPELRDRFVFMTGGAFTERAREFLETYPGVHLEKPFDLREVEAVIAGAGT